MMLPYRVAVGLVLLIAALALLVILWPGAECQPDYAGPAQQEDNP